MRLLLSPDPAEAAGAPAPSAPSPKPQPKAPFSPVAIHITPKLRENARQAVIDLKPPGNPKPDVLAIARETALKLIDSFPPEINGVEVKLEVNHAAAHQVMVLVFPHQF